MQVEQTSAFESVIELNHARLAAAVLGADSKKLTYQGQPAEFAGIADVAPDEVEVLELGRASR